MCLRNTCRTGNCCVATNVDDDNEVDDDIEYDKYICIHNVWYKYT